MTRPSFAWALCAALAACIGSSTSPTPRVMLDPILDSLFVGDKIPPPAVTYFDGTSTQTPPPSQIVWSSSDATIMAVDPPTRQITRRQRGLAVVIATINNTQARAPILVSAVVRNTLLADALHPVLPGALVPVGGPVQASNYPRTGGNAFRLEATHAEGTISEQQVQVTLTDAVVAPGPVTIDTISPGEAAARPGPLDATCSPPRAWALWTNATPTIVGYSREIGRASCRERV